MKEKDNISSRDICKIILEALRLIDQRLIAHGERVAYIIWKLMDINMRTRYQIKREGLNLLIQKQ